MSEFRFFEFEERRTVETAAERADDSVEAGPLMVRLNDLNALTASAKCASSQLHLSYISYAFERTATTDSTNGPVDISFQLDCP